MELKKLKIGLKKNMEGKFPKIKVCHIANNDATVKFLLMPQLKFLKQIGYDVSVIIGRGGKWEEEIEKEEIKIKIIRMKRKISPFSDLISLIRLIFYLRREKPRIVHTHNPKPGLLGQLAAKIAGVPIIINTIHGLYFNEYSNFLKRKFFIFIEKIAALCSDLIFSQNREDIETTIKDKITSKEKMRYLGSGIDIEKFNPTKFSVDFILKKKEELKLPFNFKIIGVVARLVKEKGYYELFEAFKKVLERFPKTTLLIIGPEDKEKKDSFKPDIVKDYQIENNVVFLGERTDMPELYSLMDIFVLPSWREGMPRSVIEAMAMQRAIVVTNIRGSRELIENEKSGILVPIKNSEKLAEALIYLLQNPEKAQEFAENARNKAVEMFDERIVFNKIKECYQELIEKTLKEFN